ncbi:MAG: baseplate J/gp47 family protein [Novosphingobium sp.]|uniref:baseplate J/gp47 family protein n=1 Tax=Novosphingobium sp. NDB2Meth1 TaxID=1892847 RepID=UPI00092FFA3B|nr:baseplate J/gp47 family protein [Novosphingobium sp. NDB2Meth1]MBY0394098.1 baseplate J/gp47 family protein [Novosphingobium sp.]
MTTYPLPTLGAQVGPAGITAPSFDDTLLSLQATYQQIYGADAVLTPDTQDGQWIAAIAQAIADVNAGAIAVYNSFSPSTAQGVGLSSVVKINGLRRETPSNSTAQVLITGTAGTVITNGQVQDSSGNVWNLPTTVTIPESSSITVTATAAQLGAISAAIGTITKILNPTRGWISATNTSAASPGAPVEKDATLRQRQARSTNLPARTPLSAILAAVRNLPGVSRAEAHENDTGTTDSEGVPANTIWLVVEGGDTTAIATAIANGKIGVATYGSVIQTVTDEFGIPSTVRFDRPTYRRIVVNVTLKPLAGYTVQTGNNIIAAINAYINSLAVGESVFLTQVIAAAIQGSGAPTTFNLTALTMAVYPDSPAAADLPMAFNQAPQQALADISLALI